MIPTNISNETNSQSKSPFSKWGFLLVTLLLIAGIILLTLNYLKKSPKLFSLPPVPVDQKTTPPPSNVGRGFYNTTPVPIDFSVDIEAVSDFPGHSLSINDKENFLKTLKDWEVFGREYGDDKFGNTNGMVLRKINIHLTSVEQPIYKITGKGGTAASTGYKFSQGTIDVYIYINTKLLDKENWNYFFNKQVLFALRSLVYKVDTINKYNEQSKIVQMQVDDMKSKGKYFLAIN